MSTKKDLISNNQKLTQSPYLPTGLIALCMLLAGFILAACSQPPVEATSLPTENVIETLVASKLT